MQRIRVVLGILAIGLAACWGAEDVITTGLPQINGKWSSAIVSGGKSYPFTLTLSQNIRTNVVTGTGLITDEEGPHNITVSSGSVMGNSVSLVLTFTSTGGGSQSLVTMAVTGTVNGSTIVGTVTVTAANPPPPNLPITLTKTS